MAKSKELSKSQLSNVWNDFFKTRTGNIKKDQELPEFLKLVECYFPFVQKIAVKLAEKMNWRAQPDELSSLGVEGLYGAICAYDTERGVTFEAFSHRRIRGSMIDGMRREDPVPRSIRISSDQFEKHRQKLQNHCGHRVCDVDFVSMIGMDELEFHKNHRKFQAVACGSLDSHNDGDEISEDIKQDSNENLIDDYQSPPDTNLRRREFLSKLLSGDFSRVERQIVYLYYYRGMTMDRVAKALNKSESRVSQMHKKILARLREKKKRNPTFFDEDVYDYITVGNHSQLIR